MVRKFVLSLTILLSLCGISFADFIYITDSGHLGTIKVNASFDVDTPSLQYASRDIDSPFVMSFWNGSGTNVLLIDRYATASGDRGYVFSPSDLHKFSASADIAGVYGTELSGFSQNGYSIFLTTGAKIYDVNTRDFSVYNSFDCTRILSRDGYATEICSLAVDESIIHVLARAGDEAMYLRFDGQLKDNVRTFRSFDVSPGASTVLGTSDSLAVVGHSSGIDGLKRDGKFVEIISTDSPVKAMCPDSSSGLFYATQTQTGSTYRNTIHHYSPSESLFTEETIESSLPDIKMLRDSKYPEVFAVLTAERITVFSYNSGETYTWEFTSSSLGGTPAGITAASVSGYSPNSGSSGCSAGFAGLIAIAIPLMRRRK